LKRKISDLKLSVVTHIHPDHAGAAQFLRKKFNIPVAAFKTIDLWYSGITGKIQHLTDIALAAYVILKSKKKYKSIYYKRKLEANYKLSDGETLPFFSDWKIIHSPGHTSHDICLFNEEHKILYAADLILEINEKFMMPFPVVFPEIMKLTFNKISHFNFNKLYIAHGTAENLENPKLLFEKESELFSGKVPKKFGILKNFIKFSKCARNFEKIYFSEMK
jgi:glyoxylase-like metal-dependent hydrolase (beta-lactamase superfamily II)